MGGGVAAGGLRSYGAVLAHPGALAFSLTGLVARLPISMAGLGIVLLVEDATGSYALAGSVSAAYMVANAVLAILQGRLLDRWGQGTVLAVAGTVFGLATAALVWAVESDQPQLVAYAAAAVAGGSLPQIGSAVRARWAHVLTRPGQVQTAYALEAVFDEVVFMLGPILVTVLATLVDPVLGLAVAAVAGSLGAWAFGVQRATAPPAHAQRAAEEHGIPLPWRTLGPLTVVSACLGVLFGAAEVTTVAFADEQGAPAWAGALLALWALGSLVSGVVTGAVAWRASTTNRLRWGATAMACAMAPLFLVGSLPVMGLVLLVGGAAIAPTLIASMSLVESATPRARLTEGMALVQTGLVAGVAPGAAASGFVVDHAGASPAYLVSLGAGLLAVLAALSLPAARDADEPSGAPTAS